MTTDHTIASPGHILRGPTPADTDGFATSPEAKCSVKNRQLKHWDRSELRWYVGG